MPMPLPTPCLMPLLLNGFESRLRLQPGLIQDWTTSVLALKSHPSILSAVWYGMVYYGGT
jgi:hypothetical protein